MSLVIFGTMPPRRCPAILVSALKGYSPSMNTAQIVDDLLINYPDAMRSTTIEQISWRWGKIRTQKLKIPKSSDIFNTIQTMLQSIGINTPVVEKKFLLVQFNFLEKYNISISGNECFLDGFYKCDHASHQL